MDKSCISFVDQRNLYILVLFIKFMLLIHWLSIFSGWPYVSLLLEAIATSVIAFALHIPFSAGFFASKLAQHGWVRIIFIPPEKMRNINGLVRQVQ